MDPGIWIRKVGSGAGVASELTLESEKHRNVSSGHFRRVTSRMDQEVTVCVCAVWNAVCDSQVGVYPRAG